MTKLVEDAVKVLLDLPADRRKQVARAILDLVSHDDELELQEA
jgi:hypothetical protein